MNYYRLHIGDYMRDAAHLSLLEHGVYTRLLQVYYTREQPITESEKYRIVGARSTEEREAVDAVLAEFFRSTSDGWRQGRCDREIAAYQEKAARNREVGALGGRPVKSGNPDETQTVSRQNPNVTLASSQEPVAKKEQKQESAPKAAPARRATQIPDGFPAEPEFAWCRAERPELDVLRTAQVFRDHHIARGSTMKSWPAAWRTWVGKERAPLPLTRASPQGPPTAADARRAFVASITGHRAVPPPDPRTIDVEPAKLEPPRIAAGCG